MKKLNLLVIIAVAALLAGIGQIAMAQQTMTRDQVRIAVQQICPVSGMKLGMHGAPVKAKIGQEEVFLCCKNCLQGKVNPQYWAKIHANFARAQGKCAVMGRPLPNDAKSTVVAGQIIYVCCPGCLQKIAANPQAYLEKVDALYAASLQAAQASR